jgi:hypothetical protein
MNLTGPVKAEDAVKALRLLERPQDAIRILYC